VAEVRLLPSLALLPAPWYVGPIFTGSQWMPANADLIAGRTLVELKTNLGEKKADGSRTAGLPVAHLRQILGYVLHDVDDIYRLDAVAIYDARYGALATCHLQDHSTSSLVAASTSPRSALLPDIS